MTRKLVTPPATFTATATVTVTSAQAKPQQTMAVLFRSGRKRHNWTGTERLEGIN